MLTIRVVSEKERHVTGAMRSTGLSDSAYWLSYWTHAILTAVIVSALVYLIGLAIGLELFTNSEGSLLYTILFVYMLSMAAAAFMIASLVAKVRLAALLVIALTIPCATLALLTGVWELITYVWWEKRFPEGATALLSLVLPPFNLAKIMADANALTKSRFQYNETTGKMETIAGVGFGWAQLNNYTVNRTAFMTYDSIVHSADEGWYVPPPPGEALSWLLGQAVLFSVLAWYFAQLCTAGDARAQPPYFFVLPSYWLGSRNPAGTHGKLRAQLKERDFSERTDLDSDVQEEMEAVCTGDAPKGTTCELLDLRRRFSRFTVAFSADGGYPTVARKSFEAVKGVCFRMQHGNLFALLGHNGAGKTTTIKLMTAQLAPSSGEAVIHGLSVTSQAPAVRALLGTCPQHDILYDERAHHRTPLRSLSAPSVPERRTASRLVACPYDPAMPAHCGGRDASPPSQSLHSRSDPDRASQAVRRAEGADACRAASSDDGSS